MSIIFIANPQRQQAHYDEAEARRLWSAGAIAEGSLYWREGMAEWRPVREFFASAPGPAPASVPAALPPVVRGFVNDPGPRTNLLVKFLWAYLAAALLAGGYGGFQLASGQAGQAEPGNLAQGLITLFISLPIFVVTMTTSVLFLMWVHQASANARGLGAQGMTYSPGWAVGWYFIPVFNFWKPFGAMKEIWQASDNPTAWQSVKTPGLLKAWWALWLASGFVGLASGLFATLGGVQAASGDGSANLVVGTVLGIASNLLNVPLCVVAVRLVREVVRRQSQWAAQPLHSVCVLCQQPKNPSEMIVLNGTWVCAQCKPTMIQRMQEGVKNP